MRWIAIILMAVITHRHARPDQDFWLRGIRPGIAMFTLGNGVTCEASLGDPIGQTGWLLVDIRRDQRRHFVLVCNESGKMLEMDFGEN